MIESKLGEGIASRTATPYEDENINQKAFRRLNNLQTNLNSYAY